MHSLKLSHIKICIFLLISLMVWSPAISGKTKSNTDVNRLVAAMLAETPIINDLHELCDEVGGRITGSDANLKAVAWAIKKFKEAGVTVRKEAFTMSKAWQEQAVSAEISGDLSFPVRVVAMPFTQATAQTGVNAALIDAGYGSEADFKHLGKKVAGSFVLVHTHVLKTLTDLFNEYMQNPKVEDRAFAAGAKGIVYMSSRPMGVLYRHNVSKSEYGKFPMVIMEREQAMRVGRLLKAGKELSFSVKLDIQSGNTYKSYNVIGEIKGSDKADEYVVIGAHLDSFELGTGAEDNGCNVTMMIDIARQMKRLNIIPRRTIRFVLWNGEEQGFVGSWNYTQAHKDELDKHVMTCSVDMGSGRIIGFYVNGRKELVEPIEKSLQPVKGMGPFKHELEPVVGTDNYDFMMQGVANLVANQEEAIYVPNYHAQSDTFDKVDRRQLKLNASIMAALTYGFANMEVTWKRQNRKQIQDLIDTTSLRMQMSPLFQKGWLDGTRGREEK